MTAVLGPKNEYLLSRKDTQCAITQYMRGTIIPWRTSVYPVLTQIVALPPHDSIWLDVEDVNTQNVSTN